MDFSMLENYWPGNLLSQFITPIRDCSVDTELICRIDRAKQKLCIRRIRTEVNRTFPTFLFQESPIQRTGSSQKWMSFKFVILRFIPFIFFTRTGEMTDVPTEISLRSSALLLSFLPNHHPRGEWFENIVQWRVSSWMQPINLQLLR